MNQTKLQTYCNGIPAEVGPGKAPPPALTRVLNLRTGETKEYTCSPQEAVVCAHEQEHRRWNTWMYDFSKVETNLKTVSCGDWTALKGGV